MLNKKNILLTILCISFSQNIHTGYVIEGQDTLDIFSYQIPTNYSDNQEYPVLVAFHQWGGNQNSPYNTQFDEEAEERGWIFLSPFGGASNNYNHQGAQYYTEQAILWLSENYSIDSDRIYMVGGSMGGASGAIYANNHLNPTKPMVAATASASGILDCERRAIEMDGNNSMIEWFGGNWDEVPFEYHRNSAVYFADSTKSMHYNLQYTPLYLDFGITEPHRTHAEDLYNLLQNYNQNMWIDTNPTGSHGFSVIDENHACDWLSQYELNDNPDMIRVKLDEPSRAYWLESRDMLTNDEFIEVDVNREYLDIDNGYIPNSEGYLLNINNYTNSDSLIFHVLDELHITSDNKISLFIAPPSSFNMQGNLPLNIGFSGNMISNSNIPNITMEPMLGTGIGCASFDYSIDDDNVIWINGYGPNEPWLDPYSDCSILSQRIYFEFSILDVNLDGVWDILDVVILVNYIVNQESQDGAEILNGDINQDQLLDILDVVLIINIILDN